MTTIHPFILSGGSGTRLWPHSRKTYPKQFTNLLGGSSLFQQTCRRMQDPLFAAPSVLINQNHRFIVAEQMRELGITEKTLILEPEGRNTAPAALVAALYAAAEDPGRLILLLPSDHVIADKDGFVNSVKRGAEAAARGHVVTFGVEPDSPATGYGYIKIARDGASPADVLKFVEKPSLEKARHYLETGGYLWNAGIFLFSAKTMIEAFKTHAPDMIPLCTAAIEQAELDMDFFRLETDSYAKCRNISIDYAIMEKMEAVKCVPLASDWNDLGAWPAVWEMMDKDSDRNVASGNVILHNTRNSYVHSVDGMLLSVVGLDNIISVATKDAILIAAMDQAQNVKHIVEQLQSEQREEYLSPSRVYRPWGWYERLDSGGHYQVKRLMVKPGEQLSMQSHRHRAEHWIVVSGTVQVSNNDKTFLMSENESTYIPIGHRHRLGNPGKLPALLIEVQSGSYLGEDDIERYEDIYGRDNGA